MNFGKFGKTIGKGLTVIGKRSPLILTGFGIVTTIAAGYFTYKSSKQLDEHLTDFEERRENGEEIETKEIVATVASDVALPVALEAVSILCFVGSYKILNNRNSALATALASKVAEYAAFRDKVKDEVGEERFKTLEEPTRVVEKAHGRKPALKEREVDRTLRNYIWGSQCGVLSKGDNMSVADTKDWNSSVLDNVNEALQTKLRTSILDYISIEDIAEVLEFDVLEVGMCHSYEEAKMYGWKRGEWLGVEYEWINDIQDPETGELTGDWWIKFADPQPLFL